MPKTREQWERYNAFTAGKHTVIIDNAPLNNLNLNTSSSLKPTLTSGSPGLSSGNNLNNLKQEPEKKRGGVPRAVLYTDGILKNAMAWGVEEWFVQICIRDYGIDTVKRTINRLYQLPEGYFKPQYGPIPKQRGKLFNKEMGKLKPSTQQAG